MAAFYMLLDCVNIVDLYLYAPIAPYTGHLSTGTWWYLEFITIRSSFKSKTAP
jgi:hypothetical protein